MAAGHLGGVDPVVRPVEALEHAGQFDGQCPQRVRRDRAIVPLQDEADDIVGCLVVRRELADMAERRTVTGEPRAPAVARSIL